MISTFGSMPTSMPPGFFKAVRFPVLALMNKKTGDGRMLDSAGGRSRDLPLSIKTQVQTAFGHQGAEISGTLFEVTFDPDADPEFGVVSGRGFLLDDEMGHKTARFIATHAMDKNSVDLAEVKARFEEDLQTGEYWVRFVEWALAATTFVATPAFAEAHGELDDTDEVFASLLQDPMEELVASFTHEPDFQIEFEPEEGIEVTASSIVVPYEHFFVPEADHPTKVTVTADNRVFGHPGLWQSCHEGIVGQCVTIPRPTDGYASFNKPGVLTTRGIVQTGPIFALGGHRPSKSAPTIEQAYGGIENAWADVRIIEGVFGPWISGVVRPGVPDEMVYAARASRLSGHWVGGRLKAIVSVNVEGYEVPGDASQLELDLVAGLAFTVSDGGVTELVASFPPCLDSEEEPVVPLILTGPAEFADQIEFVPAPKDARMLQMLRLLAEDDG